MSGPPCRVKSFRSEDSMKFTHRHENSLATSEAGLESVKPSSEQHRMARNDSYKELELRQLRSFSLAATEGNFSTAAQALGLSVTTVWEQVRALERKLG